MVYRAIDLLEGRLIKPIKPAGDLKTESNVFIVLTANMIERATQKIMQLTTSREVWLELHKYFDSVSENKVYDLYLQFFSFKKMLVMILLLIWKN